eukprot:tig00000655_g2854.t1
MELIPRPASVSTGSSKRFARGVVRAATPSAGVVAAAVQRLVDRAERLLAPESAPALDLAPLLLSLFVNDGSKAELCGKEEVLHWASSPGSADAEAYRLQISEDGDAFVVASSQLGALHGLESLYQVLAASVDVSNGAFALPQLVIEDAPRFLYRGLLIDTRFLPLETVLSVIDGLALCKMNVLHLHLSDDQGFRVESRAYPRLQEVSGEHYTQEEVRHIVAYAAERGICVVPEIDVPGHSSAILAAYPELATRRGQYTASARTGIYDACLDPSLPETYEFLDGLFGEMASLFPSEMFHIGGDEVTGVHWDESERAFFNARLCGILAGHGKRAVGWDEVLHPRLPPGAVVQSWRGLDSLAEAAATGRPGILSCGYYLDHMRSAAWHARFDPGACGAPAPRGAVLGGEACMWGELVDRTNIASRLWPRLAAIAERLWCGPPERGAGEGKGAGGEGSGEGESEPARDAALDARLAFFRDRVLPPLGIDPRGELEAALERLLPGRPGGCPAGAALREVAALVEPRGLHERTRERTWHRLTCAALPPRLVDCAQPESPLRSDPEAGPALRAPLEELERTAAALTCWARLDPAPLLAAAAEAADPAARDALAEAAALAAAAASAAAAGLAALAALAGGPRTLAAFDAASAAAAVEAAAACARRAEVRLVHASAARALVAAARAAKAPAAPSPTPPAGR